MVDISTISIGIGIVVNMIFFESFGLAAGGIVVPGYIALHLYNIPYIIATILAALLIYYILKFVANFMLIYGRRYLIMSMLMSFIISQAANYLIDSHMLPVALNIHIIGYIIPGLIAYWVERQGAVRTITAMIIGSVVTRLFLIISMGGKISL